MIRENLSRMLQNLNIAPNVSQDHNLVNTGSQQLDSNFVNGLRPNCIIDNNGSNSNQVSFSNISNGSNFIQSHKITNIIQNWNLKFDGSTNGLRIEEFLYRLRSLTNATFGGDFSIICNNLHILLTGKARDWFWAYHKKVQTIQWESFCEAIRNKYRDYKSSFDIQEELRSRKQKQGETFDAFFDEVSAIMDRLPISLPESDLVEILIRNLRPEIRQDLLYVSIYTISDLRKLVQKRENFLNDEHVKRNLLSRTQHFYTSRRQVAELDVTMNVDQDDDQVNIESSVSTIDGTQVSVKCWNCEELGHHWEDCLQDRKIFCYGCGAKHVYKPNCAKCLNKQSRFSKNYQRNPSMKD